jgi:spermidine/putrescine transport system permease protein
MSGSEGRRNVGLWSYFWIYIVLLYVPIAILIVFSFHDSEVLALPWRNFSLRWYRDVAGASGLIASLRTSLEVALLAATVAVVLGGLAGVATSRFRFPGRSALMALSLTPLIIPYLGLAVALLITFVTIGVKPSTTTIVIGHSVIAIPYVTLLVATRLVGMSPSLEEAALDLGASWPGVVKRVYLPVATPALIVAFVTAFQVSFDEFYLAYFLTGFEPTLPVFFFSSLRRPHLLLPAVALTSIVTIVSVIMIGLSWLFAERVVARRLGTAAMDVEADDDEG